MIKKKSGKVLMIIIGFIISVIGELNIIALSNPSRKVFLIIGTLLNNYGNNINSIWIKYINKRKKLGHSWNIIYIYLTAIGTASAN